MKTLLNKNLNLLFCAFLLLSIKSATAQEAKQQTLSVGLEAGIPIGMSDVYSLGLGASAKIIYPLSAKKNWSVSGSAGYYTMIPGNEANELELGRYSVIPIMAGVNYLIKSPFYLNLESGLAIGVSGGKDIRFALTPGAGVVLNKKLNLDVKYHTWNGNGLLSLGIAYNFKY